MKDKIREKILFHEYFKRNIMQVVGNRK